MGETLGKKGMASSYNSKLDASLPVSFFAAAYRFGHSLIPSAIEKWSVSHKFMGKKNETFLNNNIESDTTRQ